MEPASSIIKRLGGEAVVAKATKRALTAPYRWQASKAKRGTDGLIPQAHHLTLLELARARGVPLEAADFLPRPVPPAAPGEAA